MTTTSILFLVAGLIPGLIAAMYYWRKWTYTSAEFQSAQHKWDMEKTASTEATAQLQMTFKNLATEALEGSSKQFLELATAKLDGHTRVAKGEMDQRSDAIQQLVQPLKETLDRYQLHIRELERERQRSYSTVESELKRVVEASSTLSKETNALKDALKRPHIRGRWGEVQLKNCIDLAGMSEFADVTFQDTNTTDEGQKLIPDMTVRMPGGRIVVVDAKTPVDAFLSSLDAETDADREAQMIRHGQHVKNHVKMLSTKDYSNNLKDSADFTVMFLPNESFLYAALETQGDLVEYALEKKILIATPPTLIGLLKVIRFGWNEERLAENASKISEAGKELHKRIADFMDAYTSVGKHLEKAHQQFEVGLTRLNSRVLVQAKRLEKLGAKSKKALPVIETNGEELDFIEEAEAESPPSKDANKPETL